MTYVIVTSSVSSGCSAIFLFSTIFDYLNPYVPGVYLPLPMMYTHVLLLFTLQRSLKWSGFRVDTHYDDLVNVIITKVVITLPVIMTAVHLPWIIPFKKFAQYHFSSCILLERSLWWKKNPSISKFPLFQTKPKRLWGQDWSCQQPKLTGSSNSMIEWPIWKANTDYE